jgi:hypothetical protein
MGELRPYWACFLWCLCWGRNWIYLCLWSRYQRNLLNYSKLTWHLLMCYCSDCLTAHLLFAWKNFTRIGVISSLKFNGIQQQSHLALEFLFWEGINYEVNFFSRYMGIQIIYFFFFQGICTFYLSYRVYCQKQKLFLILCYYLFSGCKIWSVILSSLPNIRNVDSLISWPI